MVQNDLDHCLTTEIMPLGKYIKRSVNHFGQAENNANDFANAVVPLLHSQCCDNDR